ncbi:hypothetical protein BDV38DRAFT_274869 [Aspergillus pseudotamarii]|uniref:Xylanolytic transcriptional activator regulatory domain-containing protein n=1 Tax=Aspergillus pseudotamarii TaxID=132259 RepID=A0A5N6SDF6_ASPPS|nr:uncharacterized protein BDV38DRAFT_274869 [Aspergillus pseudotamarii]KAE8132756.1 hypothetical protein BDV38DRAFT_274869 [Aspergillus pseudotamarii]
MPLPESYLRKLEKEITRLRPSLSGSQELSVEAEPASDGDSQNDHLLNERLIEDSTTEHFIWKLKGVRSALTQGNAQDSSFPTAPASSRASLPRDLDEKSMASSYTYIPLDYDNAQTKVVIKLPPHSYATYLLSQFETFIGSDYHWFRHQHFRARMEATYNDPHSPLVDRTWLCCFSVVLALGESYNDSVAPSFSIDDRTGVNRNDQSIPDSQQLTPPGIELFKQGLLLLRPSYEEPTVEQVEALNLIAFYSYSLNRRKTAYAYAGMALRLASLLGLSNPLQTLTNAAEKEHRKRVWWTAICMDMMTCTELSLAPERGFNGNSLEFPDNLQLSPDEIRDFSDPQYFTAQIKLCRIKYRVIQTISNLRLGDTYETNTLINPCLQALHQWRMEFQPCLDFTENGRFSDATLAHPSMRTIASLLMRYNQCFILLLRPLLLKQLYSFVRDGNPSYPSSELSSLNNECLRAATDNTIIQHALSKCHRIAKFGFWESLHIFSSLTIHVITRFMTEKYSVVFNSTRSNAPFGPVRDLLREMARVGNAASKDHERMIQDVEDLFTADSVGVELTEEIEDLIGWSDCVDGGNLPGIRYVDFQVS